MRTQLEISKTVTQTPVDMYAPLHNLRGSTIDGTIQEGFLGNQIGTVGDVFGTGFSATFISQVQPPHGFHNRKVNYYIVNGGLNSSLITSLPSPQINGELGFRILLDNLLVWDTVRAFPVGDFDGNGIDDFVVVTPTVNSTQPCVISLVLSGSFWNDTFDPSKSDNVISFICETHDAYIDPITVVASDINDDNYNDLIIAQPGVKPCTITFILGGRNRRDELGFEFNLNDVDILKGVFEYTGEHNELCGYSIAARGHKIFIGVPYTRFSFLTRGKMYLIDLEHIPENPRNQLNETTQFIGLSGSNFGYLTDFPENFRINNTFMIISCGDVSDPGPHCYLFPAGSWNRTTYYLQDIHYIEIIGPPDGTFEAVFDADMDGDGKSEIILGGENVAFVFNEDAIGENKTIFISEIEDGIDSFKLINVDIVTPGGFINDDDNEDLIISNPSLTSPNLHSGQVKFFYGTSPVLTLNEITIHEGETITLNLDSFNATDGKSSYGMYYEFSNIQNCILSLPGGTVINNGCTQEELADGIRLKHTGPGAPSVTVSAKRGPNGLAATEPTEMPFNYIPTPAKSLVTEIVAVASGIAAFIGVTFFGALCYNKRQKDKRIETAIKSSQSQSQQFADIARKVLNGISISGPLNYLSEKSAQGLIDAIANVIKRLPECGIELNLVDEAELVDKIVEQIKAHAKNSKITPMDIEDKIDEIVKGIAGQGPHVEMSDQPYVLLPSQ